MKKGFALIYVMLFTALVGITVFSLWVRSMADFRMARGSDANLQAQQLAKTAIEDAMTKYIAGMQGTKSSYSIKVPPSVTGCPIKYYPYYLSTGNFGTEKTLQELNNETLQNKQAGFFAYQICAVSAVPPTYINGSETNNDTNDYIIGIGYYNGAKVALKSEIIHTPDVPFWEEILIDHDNNPLTEMIIDGYTFLGWEHFNFADPTLSKRHEDRFKTYQITL